MEDQAAQKSEEAANEGEGEEDGGDVEWVLLGSPWLEGFVAVRGDLLPASSSSSTTTATTVPAAAAEEEATNAGTRRGKKGGAAPAAAPPPSSNATLAPPTKTSWRRVWCVLQDSAFAFFEHERAATTDSSQPLAVVEWLHLRSLQLLTPPGTSAGPQGSSSSKAAGPAAAAGIPFGGYRFEMALSDGRSMVIRVDNPTLSVLWVREILRLASWRAVHLLQLELSSEWHRVVSGEEAEAEAEILGRRTEPPLCSSPPRGGAYRAAACTRVCVFCAIGSRV